MLRRLLDKVTNLWRRLDSDRTIIFGALLTLSGVVLELLTFLQTVDFYFLFSPRSAVIANIVIGVTVIVLRSYTATATKTKLEDE